MPPRREQVFCIFHARDPLTGKPTPDPAVYMQFLPRLAEATDAVLNVTTGGSLHMSVQERLAGPMLAKPEMCSLNMGSMNFGLLPMADRHKDWKHDWEEFVSAQHRRFHLPQHFPGYRLHPEAYGRRLRHPVRVRVLRCRAPLQSSLTRIRGFSGCCFETIAGLKVELGLERVDLVGGDGGDDVNEGVDDGSMLGQIEG